MREIQRNSADADPIVCTKRIQIQWKKSVLEYQDKGNGMFTSSTHIGGFTGGNG